MKFAVFVLVALLSVIIRDTKGYSRRHRSKPYGCKGAIPVKIGCVRGFVGGRRFLFNELLITDRDPSSDVYSHRPIDWKHWKLYINGLACRCAQAAYKKGYSVFGLQYYGECWSGPIRRCSLKKVVKAMKLHSKQCLQNYGQKCQRKNTKFACVGKASTNYIYAVLPPVNRPIKVGGSTNAN